MWHISFEDRMREWHALRQSAGHLPAPEKYDSINNWWFQAPMVNRSIQWDEYPNWPDPWQLLANNNFCDLARALGIVYTVIMLDADSDVSIAQSDQGNLVLAEQGKYILNWAPRQLLNIESANINITRQINSDSLYQLIG
jgi:hypothetical protein